MSESENQLLTGLMMGTMMANNRAPMPPTPNHRSHAGLWFTGGLLTAVGIALLFLKGPTEAIETVVEQACEQTESRPDFVQAGAQTIGCAPEICSPADGLSAGPSTPVYVDLCVDQERLRVGTGLDENGNAIELVQVPLTVSEESLSNLPEGVLPTHVTTDRIFNGMNLNPALAQTCDAMEDGVIDRVRANAVHLSNEFVTAEQIATGTIALFSADYQYQLLCEPSSDAPPQSTSTPTPTSSPAVLTQAA